ncbi:MAG: heavy metal translocating P-type ATPase [Parolsenella sp.]|uniref:heavy metal translocating P-type ATPase n=1 Tax=Parolsenella sp. TaxID=2083006 RepID=UPI002A74DE40|nr:heavy metal translocating P-type ATPase [Parolsenella sp.]MDY3291866.1 heavy metal translocating P-type ATPase [Parolsenella sp.]
MADQKKKKRRKKETQEQKLRRILIALVIFAVIFAIDELGALKAAFGDPGCVYASFVLYLVPFVIAGHDVLRKAYSNIRRGKAFDESFLMAVATIGAFATVLFPDTDPHMAEGAAVMLFYQVGELFQAYAVGKSRKSIAAMMDIAPDYANIEGENGELEQVDPDEVAVGSVIVVKPGERVPIDGTIIEGATQLDTAALTGESVPRHAGTGADVISGCINMTGLIKVRTTKPFGESTVSRILELVENASEKKAKTENFITRFARVYTPAVTGAAALLALGGGLITGAWSDWILRGLTFLVVSCPCALVISVPLSFFGGIGGASRIGVLVKGSNYLESLAEVDTVVFDKTGTLTNGTFNVVAIHPESGIDPDYVLSHAAYAEAFSDHPIALSVKAAYTGEIDRNRIRDVQEESGHGVVARVIEETQAAEHVVLVGNDKLMRAHGETWHDCSLTGTILHVSVDGRYVGHIVIADVVKDDAAQTIRDLHACGVRRCVMLTGDREEVAKAVAEQLGIDEFHAQLLPADKVERVETLLSSEDTKHKLAFVGDGINDAPVLTRADVGIAMGAMGSDAAIEAADVVLMDDKPSNISRAIRIARKTMGIVWQNIVFALAVKLLILALAACGIANRWLAVFGDVGVAIIAILNAMRAMHVED